MKNIQTAETIREKYLETEVKLGEDDSVILEMNGTVIINLDQEVNSSKLLYQDVTSDIALLGNLIKYLEIWKRKS